MLFSISTSANFGFVFLEQPTSGPARPLYNLLMRLSKSKVTDRVAAETKLRGLQREEAAWQTLCENTSTKHMAEGKEIIHPHWAPAQHSQAFIHLEKY